MLSLGAKQQTEMETRNEQIKQDKSKINTDFEINLQLNHKIYTDKDYIIAGLEREANMVASEKTTQMFVIE